MGRALLAGMKSIVAVVFAVLTLASCNLSHSTYAASEGRAATASAANSGPVAPAGSLVSYADAVHRVAPAVVRVGDVCLAVGKPLGVGESVSAGIISAKGRQTGVSTGSFEDFLQPDAPINQGNSGGALVNTRGELIGSNSQIVSSNGGSI